MPQPFRRIALAAGPFARKASPELAGAAGWLRERGFELALDEAAAALAGEPGGLPTGEALAGADLVIVFGGDGSILRTAHHLGDGSPALLGINTGHLGFMADVPLSELLPALEGILGRGEFTIEPRMRLRPRALRGGRRLPLHDVLNDVVLTAGPLARMVEFAIEVDGRDLGAFRGDGLILATPTGSTAYSLSAGGPLVMPGLEVILINPICPHTLSHRPIVAPGGSRIEMRLFRDPEVEGRHTLLTLDGHPGCELHPDDRLEVVRSPDPIRLVRPAGADFFQVLRDKLVWETHPRGGEPRPDSARRGLRGGGRT
ncbi:MAG: NAD(+)/NADH kinase [Candidatus Tectomicrobia bacterium]|nr:NAD(+)/NADH kinase [Candidatus Tectomicrobia bacterium]